MSDSSAPSSSWHWEEIEDLLRGEEIFLRRCYDRLDVGVELLCEIYKAKHLLMGRYMRGRLCHTRFAPRRRVTLKAEIATLKRYLRRLSGSRRRVKKRLDHCVSELHRVERREPPPIPVWAESLM